MIKKILLTLAAALLIPFSLALAYGQTTTACKSSGCDCLGTSVEGVCKLSGDCSKCKTPVCQTRPYAGGSMCYLVDKGECDEVYDAYKDCRAECKSLMDQFSRECKSDATGKGDYYKIPIGACCSGGTPANQIEIIRQTITGNTVTLKGDGLENVPILIKCVNATVVQSNIVSDESGSFEIGLNSEKGKEKNVTCTLIAGGADQLRVRLANVKPGEVGEIKIGTVAEYELDMKTSIMNMLIDSGIARDDAVAYVSYIRFNYSGSNPSFEEVTPSLITGKLYGANYQISMNSQAYLNDRETLYHEMTHAIAQKMFSDIAPPSPDHNIYQIMSPTGAFDEGRAHFFAYLMLKRTGEYDAKNDQFLDDKVIGAITRNKVDLKGGEGAKVEGSVAAFLKDYYVNIDPEMAWKDYIKTVNGCKETVGHSCQTINEFINQKGFVNEGVLKTAAKLGIKVDQDGTCIVKTGASYTSRDAKTIQLDAGDVECGSRDVRVNDIQILDGGTQYVVSVAGDIMSIAVLEGSVKATNVNNNETADVAAGNEITYSTSAAKFSAPKAIDINRIEKFWEGGAEEKPAGRWFFPLLAGVFVLGGIAAILAALKFTKKKK